MKLSKVFYGISGTCISVLSASYYQLLQKQALDAKEDADGIEDKLKLTQVQVVFRHGARTPLVLIEDKNTTFQDVLWDKKKLETTLDSNDIPFTIKFPNGKTYNNAESLDSFYKDRPKLNVRENFKSGIICL